MASATISFKAEKEELLRLCSRNIPNFRSDVVEKAFDFAMEAHKNFVRKSNEPFFSHPIAVARILASELPLDDVSVACGLLHDVVEDNDNYNIDIIKKNFGNDIAVIVDGLTKIKNLFKGSEFDQAEYYRKLLLSITKDIRVIIVKLADRLNNMRTLEFLDSDKRKKIAKETLEIYAPLSNRFGLGQLKWELEDLAFKELNKQAYEDLKRKINAKRTEREEYIERFKQPMVRELTNSNIKYEISGRAKHLYSIYRKMIKRNKPFSEIYDLFAIRIILESDSKTDCYTVHGVVNGIFTPVPDRFKDYIAIPKANNYQSLHTTVVGPDGKKVEVQIRTRKMHEVAEQGVAAHWKYKEGKSGDDPQLVSYIAWIRDILESSTEDEYKKGVVDNFKLDLYSDEIFIFTPKGDLKRLPVGSTPVDFAFQVHSKVGHHCIGAKVNHKLVPLDFVLKSGDQVEILTSKNQHPNKNWLKFVKTTKAVSDIKKWLNKEDEALFNAGKDLWEKKLKKLKLSFTNQDLNKIIQSIKLDNTRQFFMAVGQSKINVDELLTTSMEKEKKSKDVVSSYENFKEFARSSGGQLAISGENFKMLVSYSKCCSPIPGDDVLGFVSIGGGIRIHRADCKNMGDLAKKDPEKVVSIFWPEIEGSSFIVGLSINGLDSPGILNNISNTILNVKTTNIKSINIDTHDGVFKGIVTLYVMNKEHLNSIIDKVRAIEGVYEVRRLDEII